MSIHGWENLLQPVNIRFLLDGLFTTLSLASVSLLLSLMIGALVAAFRSQIRGVWVLPLTVLIEILRNIPVLVLIFFIFFGLPLLGFNVSPYIAAILALTLYNSSHLSEVIRGGILAVPIGQSQAANSAGMTKGQVYAWVVIPQAFRSMLPAVISQCVILIKGTVLASAINLVELTRSGQIIFSRYGNPLETLLVIAVVYFAVNFALGSSANRLDSRMRRRGLIAAE